jgi:hypothetical protein
MSKECIDAPCSDDRSRPHRSLVGDGVRPRRVGGRDPRSRAGRYRAGARPGRGRAQGAGRTRLGARSRGCRQAGAVGARSRRCARRRGLRAGERARDRGGQAPAVPQARPPGGARSYPRLFHLGNRRQPLHGGAAGPRPLPGCPPGQPAAPGADRGAFGCALDRAGDDRAGQGGLRVDRPSADRGAQIGCRARCWRKRSAWSGRVSSRRRISTRP